MNDNLTKSDIEKRNITAKDTIETKTRIAKDTPKNLMEAFLLEEIQ